MTTEPTKRCNTCNLIFPATTDYFYRRSGGTYEYQCKKCANKRKRKYDKNAAIRAKKTKVRALNWYRNYKSKQSCYDCGCSNTECLEFHHIDKLNKTISPSQMAWQGWSIARMENELCKCIVLCVNCHRKKHYSSMKKPRPTGKASYKSIKRSRARRKLLFLIENTKKTGHCLDCGESDFRILEFHHRDPIDKICVVSHMPKRGFGKQKILNEIVKCDLLCGNCHRISHQR